MITNERQRRLTAAAIGRFERALADAEATGPRPDVHPTLQRAMVDGMRSQLTDLKDEVRAYDDLRAGRVKKRVLHSLSDLADALIEARIAAQLTQGQLADRLDIPEQQVQRYEQTRYRTANLERLQAIADALQLGVRESVEYHVPSATRRGGARPQTPKQEKGIARDRAARKAGASPQSKSKRTSANSKAKRPVASDATRQGSGRKAAATTAKTAWSSPGFVDT